MEYIAGILNGSNAMMVLTAIIIIILIVAFLSRVGLFSFVGRGLRIGHNEKQTRSLLLKQVNYVNSYAESKVEEMLLFAKKKGIQLDYFKTEYVMLKMINQAFLWLVCNNINDSEDYISLKTEESKNIVLKSISKVNHSLLENEDMLKYFENVCRKFTEDIISGVLKIKRMEGF